jgi:succinate dehydrogenase/fumarate reductase flavoprotein subunit
MPNRQDEFDLVILGAGAGGLTAALVAMNLGLRALIIEKTQLVGGTTARSGGALWIPNSRHARARGWANDAEEAHRYLDALVGDRAPRYLREAYIDAAPQMVDHLDTQTGIGFELAASEVDYRTELPGASTGGRVLRPLPFDARLLGREFKRVAPPLPELMLFGGMMLTRGEAARLLELPSPSAVLLGTSLLARYVGDRIRYARGTRLVLGNALVARLFHGLIARNVPIRFGTHCRELVMTHGRVTGVVVQHNDQVRAIRALRGVVLAGGGFAGNAEMRTRLLPSPVPAFTPASDACTGDTLLMAERVGAAFYGSEDNALWFPSSVRMRSDGSTAVFPHIVLDRAKPGLVAVDKTGKRFVNEAVSYHEFVRAMYRAHHSGIQAIPTRLVCDHHFLWKYGIGMIRPHTRRLDEYVRSDYLIMGHSIEALARKANIDTAGLAETIARHNRFAREGIDRDFGKGNSAYDRSNGDPSHKPNPCLGPLETPPFFSVNVFPTPLATSWGVQTNRWGETLDTSGREIKGLYACGNDMQSIMGGEYPGPGAQIGPAMTFAYLVATHAAKQR